MTHTIPTHLSDTELIDAVARCARGERDATARLVAHLGEMDARRLHLGAGYPSLFAYCCEVLRLSESATCKRIEVARAARRHPVLLDRLADGSLSLTTARSLASHLTDENHAELVAAAAGLRSRAVEELVARRFPRPDVAPLVRKLPPPRSAAVPSVAQVLETLVAPAPTPAPTQPIAGATVPTVAVPVSAVSVATASVPLARPSAPPPRVATPLAADRYQIRFTARAATWKKLRVAQDLLRHAVPGGDPAEIFDRALTALIEDLARRTCARVAQPAAKQRATAMGSRHVPAQVRRAVWVRDQGRCAFVSRAGRRCRESGFLEFHHVEPFAAGGAATVANIQLRCRAHNGYESVLFYGAAKALRRETVAPEAWTAARAPSVQPLSREGSTSRADGGRGRGIQASAWTRAPASVDPRSSTWSAQHSDPTRGAAGCGSRPPSPARAASRRSRAP